VAGRQLAAVALEPVPAGHVRSPAARHDNYGQGRAHPLFDEYYVVVIAGEVYGRGAGARAAARCGGRGGAPALHYILVQSQIYHLTRACHCSVDHRQGGVVKRSLLP